MTLLISYKVSVLEKIMVSLFHGPYAFNNNFIILLSDFLTCASKK